MKNVILLITFLAATYAAADNTPEDTAESKYSAITKKRYSNYIGIAAGFITGYGLSYRRWINNKWGFQINLFPLYYEEKYDDDDDDDENYHRRDSGYSDIGHLSIGAIFLRNLSSGKYIRFVFYSGANLQTEYEKYDYYGTESIWDEQDSLYKDRPIHRKGKKIENKISIGAGAGCEWYIWRFAFHCMLGMYGAFVIEPRAYEVGPSIEGGLHFRF